MSAVRVRFAPSPTGELHVGGLRTALFNYLFAKSQDGDFILRIEDTDQTRFVEHAEQRLSGMLAWAGVHPDESPSLGGPHAPYRQSERLPLYQRAAQQLIEQGHAYKCYCSPGELDEMRQAQQAQGAPLKYDGRHRNLSDGERSAFEAEGRIPVVRMRLPDREEDIVVEDLIRGKVVINSGQLEDQIILKSDGFPTYHLAVVVDDHAMAITHVLRAEEWLPSTPKHLYLMQWLGYDPPKFAHLPLLLNPDRSKMSKRMGDVSVEDFKNSGYLPDALVNFLALLGWNPGDDEEIFSRELLLERFSVERIGKAGAVFDRDKLDWMNQSYVGKMEPGALYEELKPFIARTPYAAENPHTLRKIIPIIQPAVVKLSDIGQHLRLFFREDDLAPDADAVTAMSQPQARIVFERFRDLLIQRDELDSGIFREVVKQVQKDTGVKGKALWGSLRAAITMETSGPDLGGIVAVYGMDKTLDRIDRALSN